MKVTIVIPNYNGKHFMGPCLESLKQQSFTDFKILVVDNASTDGSLDYMKENYPQIQVIPLKENYGFSKAVNVGIKKSRTPFVILLNNDTTVDPNYVKEMVKAIEKSPKIFAVSSKMIQMYHPELIDSAGDLYTILGWGVCRGNGSSISNFTEPEEIFTACAGAAIYRRSAFARIGYFDENHFAYLEDIDVGYRARIYGYKNTYCPTALVYHVGSGTSGSKYNAFKVKLSSRNNLYLCYKNMPALQLILNAIPISLGIIIKYIFFLKQGLVTDYHAGIMEGLKTMTQQKKVPFKLHHLPNYIQIEWELIQNIFTYIKTYLSKEY